MSDHHLDLAGCGIVRSQVQNATEQFTANSSLSLCSGLFMGLPTHLKGIESLAISILGPHVRLTFLVLGSWLSEYLAYFISCSTTRSDGSKRV